jgi:replicative DNA helicase
MENKVLPHSIEAEEYLLGQVLLEPSCIPRILEYIKSPEAFYNGHNQTIWSTIVELYSNGKDVNFATVADSLPESQKKYIKTYYISGLSESVVSTADYLSYANIIREKWLLRKIVNETTLIQADACKSTAKAHESLEKLHETVTKAINMQPTKKFDMGELLDKTVEKMYDENNLIKFGYGQVDNITGGMTRGEITVIAGRPSMGKSTVMINIVRKLIENGMKVMVFNREMTNIEMMKKIFIIESGDISYRRLRLMQLTDDEREEVKKTKKAISKKYENLRMFDDIRDLSSAVAQINKFKPDVIIDDYIQMVKIPNIEDKRLQIVEVMQHYKWLAKSLNCSIILLSQLNRELEKKADKRPSLSNLSESGSIETDAETVIFIYYQWKYLYRDHHPRGSLGKYEIQLLIDKNRYGETGYAEMGFFGDGCLLTETKELAYAHAEHAGELVYDKRKL